MTTSSGSRTTRNKRSISCSTKNVKRKMTLKILRNYLVGAASNEYVFNRHITIGRLRKVG